MKNSSKLFVTILTLGQAFLFAQTPPKPPTSDRTPIEVNPFVDTLHVRLYAESSNLTIYYDRDNDLPFTIIGATEYVEGTPIVLGSTSVLRAATVDKKLDMSDVISWSYVKNVPPTVTFSSPSNNQIIHPGESVLLKSSVTDPTGPAPHTIRYSRKPFGSEDWIEVGTGNSSFEYTWAVPDTIKTGTQTLRVIATDAKGLQGTKEVSVNIVAENRPPTVSLAKPLNNATYVGPAAISLQATPADPDGVITKVEFVQNGELIGPAKTAAPWTHEWTGVPVGSYVLTAVAYDNNVPPEKVTSSPVKVTVAANKLPTVSLTYPVDGGVYYSPFNGPITANALDSDGSITNVDFYSGDSSQFYDDLHPYAYSKPYPPGTYNFFAKAYDDKGGWTQSEKVTFTVADNQAPTARAGADTIIVLPTNSVLLKGGTSTDPEGTALKYEWSGPGVTFTGANTATPTVQVSGTGSWIITLKVTDQGSPAKDHSDQMTITVNSKPSITSATAMSGTEASPFSYTLTATGIPPPTLSATGLPAWLSFNASTGVLSGTPTDSGVFPVTLSATNTYDKDTETLTITINNSPVRPSITSPLTATAEVGIAFNYTITANGNPAPTFTTGTLPGGLSRAGALISGSPTVSGRHTIGLTATNTQGNETKNLVLTINADPTITTDLNTEKTVLEKTKVTLTVAATGFPAPTFQWKRSATAGGTYTIIVGAIGTTYTIDSASLTSSPGYYRVSIKNSVGEVNSKVCRLIVSPLPAPIKMVANSGPLLKNAIVGERVVFRTRATGAAVLQYEWFKNNVSVKAPSASDSLVIASAQTGDAGIYRARVTNSHTDLSKPETFAMSDTARLSVELPKLAPPASKPSGGAFVDSIKITLSTAEAGADIYYTLNGDRPTSSSVKFSAGDTIRMKDSSFTLKARAFKAGFIASEVMSVNFTYTPPGKVFKPVINPPAPTFQGSMVFTLTSGTPGASIYYTDNGSSPLLATAKPYSGPVLLNATTHIIAVAKMAGMTDSDTLMMTYTLEKIQSKVLAPVLTPSSRDFTGQIQINMLSPTDSVAYLYTTDGTSPDSSTTVEKYVPGVPVTLTKTTTIKVFATRPDFLNSDIVTEVYRLIPGPITANPRPDTIFESPITVKLTALPPGAVIRYVTDGVPSQESLPFPEDGLRIDTTANISAIAIMDGVSSQVYRFSFTKRGGQLATPIPTTPDNLSTFKDTVRVSLRSTTRAEIYYTLNGDPPKSGTKYTGPFLIDTTSTLQAVAMMAGFENSKVLSATYTLVPGRPDVFPSGGSFPTAVHVKLSSSSKRASLYYTQDGSDPVPENRIPFYPGDSIPIGVTTTLKTVAVAGNMASPIREEFYDIFGVRDFSIIPGQTASLEGGYTIRSSEDQIAHVKGQISGAGPLKLVGFEGVQYALTLALADQDTNTGAVFPKLSFTSPSSDKRSMYRIDPSQKVYFISSADTVTLSQAGTYFMGIDAKPPVITYIGESFHPTLDSTRVTFHIEDNVANLTYDMKRNDDVKRNETYKLMSSGQELSVQLLHPPGILKPLYVQVIVSDYDSVTSYPADRGTMLALSQRMGDVKGPPDWGIGASKKFPYDLISIPLDLDPPVTLKDLRAANPDLTLQGVYWNNTDTVYKPMDENQTLMPGYGYWLGSLGRVTSFSRPAAVTLPSGTGTFTVQLRHGWNQIGNPHLEEMYWPYSRNQGELYKGFPIKGLWEYSPAINDYVESESLKPWRGYFVYNYLQETSVKLSPRPISEWGMRKEAAAGQINLALGWGSTRTVRLGADWTSAQGLGVEDEFALPRQNKGLSMQALREGRALASDWIRLEQSGILQWKVAMGISSQTAGGQSGSGDTLPPLRILSQNLPGDYETWAVSPSRGMKFRVEAGKQIPASGLAQDTLLIFSGPKDKMASFGILQKMAIAAPSLDLRVSARKGGFGMQMALPSKARIRAIVWGLDGTRKGELVLGPLSEGLYRFAYDADFRNRPGHLPPGMYFLSLEIQGAGLKTRLSRKIVLPN